MSITVNPRLLRLERESTYVSRLFFPYSDKANGIFEELMNKATSHNDYTADNCTDKVEKYWCAHGRLPADPTRVFLVPRISLMSEERAEKAKKYSEEGDEVSDNPLERARREEAEAAKAGAPSGGGAGGEGESEGEAKGDAKGEGKGVDEDGERIDADADVVHTTYDLDESMPPRIPRVLSSDGTLQTQAVPPALGDAKLRATVRGYNNIVRRWAKTLEFAGLMTAHKPCGLPALCCYLPPVFCMGGLCFMRGATTRMLRELEAEVDDFIAQQNKDVYEPLDLELRLGTGQFMGVSFQERLERNEEDEDEAKDESWRVLRHRLTWLEVRPTTVTAAALARPTKQSFFLGHAEEVIKFG